MNEGSYDAALESPDDDLLGVAPSAEVLAARLAAVRPPFTIGIYGEWGSGKTTFVSFVANYLSRALTRTDKSGGVVYIPFSAWPYKNADEIWRALILAIGRKLLGLPDTAPSPAPAEPDAWSLKRFLASDVFVIREEPMMSSAEVRYAELVARLDSGLFGGIGKTSSTSLRLNSTEASLAIAKSVVAALAATSPVMAGLRRIVGLEGGIETTKVFDREQNESTRRRIESIDAFKATLRGLFRETLNGRRVFVFVDDLDRCMPDAALDLLDAITIFLNEDVPCIFMVAADETLIGQGLKMRLRDAVQADSDANAQTFLETKGREYFEKIIQLPVRLPRPAGSDIQRFVGASFPEWMPASDLIETAIGTNPRRIKQYCSRLQYRRKVIKATSGPTLFDELVTMRSKSEDVFQSVLDLARTDRFRRVIGELERWAQDAAQQPVSPEARKLVDQIGSSRPLRRILADPPAMSEADCGRLLMLAEFADLRPDRERMFHTADPVFMRLLDASKLGPITVSKLVHDDFAKLASLWTGFPAFAAKLAETAKGDAWTTTMYEVEAALRPNGGTPTLPAAISIADIARQDAPSPDGTTASTLVCSAPLLSSMAVEEVLAFDQIYMTLPSPESLIDPEFTPRPSLAEKGRALAQEAVKSVPADVLNTIEEVFRSRHEIVQQVIELRMLVKKDLLDHCWPALFDLMRRDYAGLVQLEKEIQSPDVPTGERLKPLLKDERLVRFFRLQPHFRDFQESIPAASVEGSTASPEIEVPLAALAPVGGSSTAAVTVQLPRLEFENVHISLTSDGLAPPYVVEMKTSEWMVRSTLAAPIDWNAIHAKLQGLPHLRRPEAAVVRDLAAPEGDVLARLKSLGLMVYDLIFQGEARHKLLELVALSRSIRLLWQEDAADPDAAALPWESLYVPTAPVGFLGLTRTYSLIRQIAVARSMVAPPITGTPRVLFVTAEPSGVAPLAMVDQEATTLEQTARASGNRVDLRVIRHANPAGLREMLFEFRPHIFHFSGHGVYRDGVGYLVFEAESGVPYLIAAEEIAYLLHENDVLLAILNGCDTGISSANNAVSSVARALIRVGVPAVVATMREVQHEEGMLFTRDFYRAFLAGFTVEAAVAEARKALSLDHRDWAAYALFVGSADLAAMRVVTGMRSDAPS